MWPRTGSAVRRGCSRTITCTLLLMTVQKTHKLSSLFIILLQYNCQLSTLHTSLVRRDTELCRAAAPVLGQFRSATDTRAVKRSAGGCLVCCHLPQHWTLTLSTLTAAWRTQMTPSTPSRTSSRSMTRSLRQCLSLTAMRERPLA